MKSVTIRRDSLPDHPWIYRKQVLRPEPGTRNGDPVRILLKTGAPAGAGLYHGKSQIAIRVLSRDPAAVIDEAFVRARIDEAVDLRRRVLGLDARTDAYRLINSEGDGLSGLVVDRYGPVLSAQIKCQGMFRLANTATEALCRHFPKSSIVYRRDAVAEKIEGFRVPEPRGTKAVEISSDGVRMAVDAAAGHKTGAFLDQRDNRTLAATSAKGRRVLDLFCYEGAFALACAKAGAASVRGADLDEKAVARAKENARLNSVDIPFDHGDAFEILRAGPDTDFLLLDPPKWINSRDDMLKGQRRYLELNTAGLSILPPGGLILSSSCSGRLPPEEFLSILRAAASRAGRDLRILEVRGASPGPPVAADFPEGRYLTAVLGLVR